MNFSFSNPLGLWALLGLPAVVVIHLLQRRSRRQVVTTLFLLQQMRRESETGNRIERLRTSPPFWMQLLMVLLLTWLLAQPRWLKNDAVQRIAVVLDSSASMQAFREPALQAVRDVLDAVTGPATRAELTLMTSDTETASLYHGGSTLELMKAAATWEPLLGVHDFTPALRTARSLTGVKGVVVLVSDHATEEKPPFDAHLVSVGEKTVNVGFAGMAVEEKDGQWFWRAMVRNYSDATEERVWHAQAAGAKSEPKKLILRAGETQTLSGPFPPGDVVLELSPDAFTLDDRLPMVRPVPKILALNAERPWLVELMERFAHVRMVEGSAQADVIALETNGDSMPSATQHACVFLPSPAGIAGNLVYLKGNVVAETHPLMAGLNWQGLLVRETPPLPRTVEDRVLLWQGERPLISLRQTKAGARQLLCHFDVETSNARKLPALAVLLHRFLEGVREEKLAPEAANFDLRERLKIAHRVNGPELLFSGEKVPVNQARLLRAPSRPGVFDIQQGDASILHGAAHFADTREADLSKAKPFQDLADLEAAQVETTHEADPNWRLWLLAMLAALLASWWWSGERQPEAAHA